VCQYPAMPAVSFDILLRMQYVAVSCSMLQCVAVCCSEMIPRRRNNSAARPAVSFDILLQMQCVAVCCSVLQCICRVLQCAVVK